MINRTDVLVMDVETTGFGDRSEVLAILDDIPIRFSRSEHPEPQEWLHELVRLRRFCCTE